MQKLLTGLAAAAALALSASFAQAECAFHKEHVTASTTTIVEPDVAMSTYDPTPVPVVADAANLQAALPECPADTKDCVRAKE